MAPQAVATLVDVAKASVTAYNEKNWDKARASLTPDVVYDEVATNRKAQGINDVLTIWRGWAAAMPDSKATFNNSITADNQVVLELTWIGTHTGPLQTPAGEIPATGKKIQLRACQIVELNGEKVRRVRHYFDMGSLLQQLGVEM